MKNNILILALGVMIMSMSACNNSRKAVKGIDEDYAKFRSSLVSNVHYDLSFHLDAKRDIFDGRTVIHFNLSNIKDNLTIDFQSGTIQKLFVNDQSVKKPIYNQLFITLPKKHLKKGRNKVTVEYSHPFSKTGSGLYRFKDPEDGNVYTYSDFEPFDANQMFPCFDQPDLKATYTLTSEVPGSWQVVSATREVKVEKLANGRKLWIFPKSAKFSTYIFSMHAGPYKIWKSKAGAIPIRLYARASFAKYVDPKEWFKLTKQGLGFFNDYFGYAYPFKKYDQLMVPDFNSGAMENVGAVTFNEGYLPRGKATREQREHFAEVILHEMAHMWFGNLVTMAWWDDLWLNESFATYLSYLAYISSTEFKEGWQTFYSSEKNWAYWEDQLVTTHPIVGKVNDTETAFVNFDGITYGKGASVLKQLHYYLGDKSFKKGVQSYFKKYAFQNTRMKDFIGSLGKAAGKDLTVWTEQWLMKASLNTVGIEYDCTDDKMQNIKLTQTHHPKYKTLRAHRTKIGLYKLKKGKVVLDRSMPFTYDKKLTAVKELEGVNCPLLVYPNEGDYDFAKIKLDPRTISALKENLSNIEDSFVRVMFWQSLWDMVRDAQLPIQEFSELIFKHLKKEKNVKIAKIIANRMSYGSYYLPRTTAEHLKQKDVFVGRTLAFLWKQLEAAKPGSDFQKLWFDTYVKMVDRPEAQKNLVHLLNGKIKFKKLEIDQDRRWNIIVQLHRYQWKGAEKLRKAELKRDTSEKGKKSSLASEVIQPSKSIKQKWFKKVSSIKSDLSLARMRTAMSNLFPSEQEDLQRDFTADFYANIKELSKKKPGQFLSDYSRYLAPSYCSKESVKKMASFIQKNKNLPPVVVKRLKVANQENERCVHIREVARQYRP